MNQDAATTTSLFEVTFQFLSILGGIVTIGGGLIAWFRLRPELQQMRANAAHTLVQSAVSEDAAEDAHWQAIIKAQAEAVVSPLRDEVEALRGEVRVLRAEVEAHRVRYLRAITYIRVLLAWARHPSTSDAPAPPPELAVDI